MNQNVTLKTQKIAYEDGFSVTQYFVNDGTGWLFIDASGCLCEIPDEGEIADAFAELTESGT